jgi:mono/diheme cytochrome c family protein
MKTFLPLVLAVGCGGGGQTPDPFGVPITGGTLLVTNDGARAVVADPDRDRIVTIDIASGKVITEEALTLGDEPGRLVEDIAGRVHVALRRGGAVVTLDATGKIIDRRYACAEPRGIAYDATADSIHVACTGGELVTFASAGGPPLRDLRIDRDLRDVVVSNNQLVLTRFKTAEIITLDAAGNIVSRVFPPSVPRFDSGFGGPIDAVPEDGSGTGVVDAKASTAWRTIAMPDGRIVMSHQRKVKDSLDSEQPGGYGGDCGGGPVEDAITVMAPGGLPQAVGQIGRGALPVDIAATRTGDKLALVVAGNRTVTVVSSAALGAPDEDKCEPPPPPPPCDRPDDDITGPSGSDGGECCDDQNFDGRCDDDDDDDDGRRLGPPTSVAFTPTGDLLIFYPEAPALVVRTAGGPVTRRIDLSGGARNDPGRNVFHAQTRIGLACASCHPEGREDGLVWNFAQFGVRRTQSLAGHIQERAPYHWTGDMTTLNVLMDDVFAKRMSGGILTENQKAALGPWLNRIPVPAPRTIDQAAAARGQAIFDSAEVGCVSCHNGGLMTNNLLFNVGTGAKFKVPSLLGIGARAPFMHDGCATTLMDRFVTCGNSTLHGNTSALTTEQLKDLVEYLESL